MSHNNVPQKCVKSISVMEQPMLLEDYEYGKVPQSITNIIKYLEESTHKPPNNNDLIVGFIYILMLEAGFVPFEAPVCDETCDFNYRRLLEQTRSIIGLRKIEGNAYLDFVLLRSVPHICSVSCVSAGDDLIVNCIIKGYATFTLMLDPLGYFTGSKRHPFQNLNQLSRRVKSSISWPAKVEILKASKVYYPSLEWIAPEIQIQIMTYLDIDSVFNLAKTCTALCQSANCVGLWIQLLNTYFKKRHKYKSVEELQFLYEALYEPDLFKIMSEGPNIVLLRNEDRMKRSRSFYN